jgi:hypothetical protein
MIGPIGTRFGVGQRRFDIDVPPGSFQRTRGGSPASPGLRQ